MQFNSAKDLKMSTTNLKIYGLGAYGTGKSVFASTFPTPGFVFDFDQRIETYKGRDWDYVTIPMTAKGWVEFETAYREVIKRVGEGEYKTVVLDSTSSFTDCAMERALQLDPKRSNEGGPIWNIHYSIVKNLVEPKLHGLLSLECHVIMLGHWAINTDARTGAIISVDPMLTGNLSVKVPGYFNEIFAFFSRTREGKEQFYFRTVSQGFYKARSTISGPRRLLPAEIPNHYVALRKHITEAEESQNQQQEETQKEEVS